MIMSTQPTSKFKKKRMKKLQESNSFDRIYSNFSLNDDYSNYYYQETGYDKDSYLFVEGILDEMQHNINDKYYSKPNKVIKAGEYKFIDKYCYI